VVASVDVDATAGADASCSTPGDVPATVPLAAASPGVEGDAPEPPREIAEAEGVDVVGRRDPTIARTRNVSPTAVRTNRLEGESDFNTVLVWWSRVLSPRRHGASASAAFRGHQRVWNTLGS